MDQKGRWVESSIYYTRRIIWANSNVLQTYKLISDISDYNEQNPLESHQC